jgi:hypothetical protein
VSFNDEIKIKPKTVLKSIEMDTFERNSFEIQNFQTIDEINNYCDKLIENVLQLKKNKEKGYDISDKIDMLLKEIDLLKDVRFRIYERNENIKGNCVIFIKLSFIKKQSFIKIIKLKSKVKTKI